MTALQPPSKADFPERSRRHDAVLQHMQMGLVVYHLVDPSDDASLTVEEINPAAACRLNLVAEEARGQRMVDLFPSVAGDSRLKVYADVARGGPAIDLGEISYGDARLARRDYAVKAVPLPERCVGLLFEDVTEQAAARRLKSEFVSMVSHELRTPLTSIRGAVNLLASGRIMEIQPQARELLDIADKNCERLTRLINDLLDVEKTEAGQMPFAVSPQEAGAALEGVRAELAPYALTANVSLDVEPHETPYYLLADPDRLRQLLVNLVSNAVKFSPRGAAVTLKISCSEEEVRFEVRDRGPGIPESFRSRIFQKFAQSELGSAVGGSGLGLALAKNFTERMGGTLDFESEEGLGTLFIASFPLLQQGDKVNPEAEVLIVEDDLDVAHLMSILLAQEGIPSDLARSASEARRFLSRKHRYRAITLDLLLSEESGFDVLREIRKNPETRELPVVVVSAIAKEGRQELEGRALNVLDWLDKPIDLDRLRHAIHQAMRDRGPSPRPILHVEDDLDLRIVVASSLEGLAPIVQAGSLRQARAWLQTQAPSLILLDLVLPDGNGLDLLQDLSDQACSAPVVIFSAHEPPREHLSQVSAVLVKTRNSHAELRETLLRLLKLAPGDR